MHEKAFDAVVVGGGPAGSIAALSLAHAGVKTLLIEKHEMPRDKVCGDALIPDAITLLEEVGLLGRVRDRGHSPDAVRVYSPNGHHIDVKGRFITLPRLDFDKLLFDAAINAGVETMTGTARAFEADENQARILTGGVAIRTQIAILTTGAASKALAQLDVPHRSRASAIAMRAYFRLREGVPENRLHIWYEKPILPGYGWIFPLGDRLFNVGVGLFQDGARTQPNLRDLFGTFRSGCPVAAEMLRDAELVAPAKAAPLRSALRGTQPSKRRLLVAGEAVGATYSFSGEGIGKAMETGRLAAQYALKALSTGDTSEDALRAYDEALERNFRPKFRQYEIAQRWVGREAAVNLMIWKANRSARVRSILEDIVEERGEPTEILSFWGMVKALLVP